MRREPPPLGKLLLERGVLPDARALDDVLARQGLRMPVASLCYVLGYAPERALVATLAAHRQRSAVVLDESVIALDVLGGLARETAVRARVLPVYEDERRLVLAAADPEMSVGIAAELERVRGRMVDVHLALEVTLARTIRACYAARLRGDRYWVGPEAMVDPSAQRGRAALVDPEDPDAGRVDEEARAHRALIDDVTKEIAVEELFLDEEMSSVVGRALTTRFSDFEMVTPDPQSTTDRLAADLGVDGSATDASSASSSLDTPWPHRDASDDDEATVELIAELELAGRPSHAGPPRILIVDDDFATRHLLVKELQPLGYVTLTAADGGEAVQVIRQQTPDLVVADILLPEIDGFRLCRAIKRSRALAGVAVVLMSAVIDSGRVTDDVLARYAADAYLEKPLDTRRVHKVVRELLGRRRGKSAPAEAGFQRAIEMYQSGEIDGALALLRSAIASDPSSAKYRFVLGNVLQRKAQIAEAIDEYESVIELEPGYFPALTRLAYLYYRQGMIARAIDTWRRSLPLCPDPGLRRNIELFMRKLVSELGTVSGAG